ncbi:MAG TPA: YegS/Rv2252/BmrU family lipid kinase [Gemmatimonadaceae bacterium]
MIRSGHRHFAMIIHGARAEREDVRHLIDWVRAKGHVVEPHVTLEAGDATAMAAAAARAGVDAVIAVGGDGTVNEVVNGLDGFDTPLGIIPLGTANDFATQAGIPADADHAMDVILHRKPVRIDTGTLNGRRFVNMSTGGVGAEATAETPPEVKETLGPVAYAISGVRKLADLEPHRATFRGRGFDFSGEFLMFAVGVTRASGGGTLVTPNASVTDGLLDVCVVESMGRADFARLALKIKRGEHLAEPGVHYAQVPSLVVDSVAALSVNVDGESVEGQRLDYAARAKDLWVHVMHLPDASGEPTSSA